MSDPALDESELREWGGVPPAPSTPGGSVLDGLRARREQLAHESAEGLTLDVPGYAGRLAVRYRYPEAGYQPVLRAVQRAQAQSQRKDSSADLDANCDLLVVCCESVLGRDARGDLVDLETSAPVGEGESSDLRFGTKLAGLFGLEIPEGIKSPARFVVRHVFSPRAAATGVYDGDIALMTQAGQVMAWLAGQEESLAEDFVGE